MTYTPTKPPIAPTSEQLRASIPGWGVDLDPSDRPSVPRERFDLGATGAHWDFPERQPEKWPRERSIEHEMLTPVFGTAQPPRGLSGAIRKLSYARYSEARAAHWLLLVLADRVDAVEHHAQSLLSLRPDNPITQTGIKSEITANGVKSRFGRGRTDVIHHPLDPIIVAGPWVVAGVLAYRGARALARRRNSSATA
ncbi:MAG TPA: hypothetical protein VLA82_11535 [Actinomycetota bacterium]|nr:hypothetical protein [Actinomycetota bacterium]